MPASVVIQTSFLGDMVLTTPLIAHLAQRGPVDVVATALSAPLLANNPSVRDAIVYDKRGTDRGTRGFMRLVSTLRSRRYDAAYHAQGSVRSGALTLAAGIARRVGFETSAGQFFYNVRVPVSEGAHHASKLLSLATFNEHSEPASLPLRPVLFPGAAERALVDAVLASSGSRRLVAFAPGSVWGTKRWPYYAELARQLHSDATIVVVGAAADQPLAAEIVAAANGNAIDATGHLPLLASAELIGRAALLVTNDSAPLHLASAMNTPTVAVFGPTVPAFGFGPLADQRAIAEHQSLACRPCDRHGPQQCPLGHWRCMREITADDVAHIARSLLTPRQT